VAHDVAALQSRIEELEQRLERKDVHIEALKAEVIRLRRWRFGRSAETLDPNVAPQLPLVGVEAPTAAAIDTPIDAATIPRLVSVDAPHATRLARRPVRALPPELPRVIRVHAPASCSCPECGDALRQLGEDTSSSSTTCRGTSRSSGTCGRSSSAAPARGSCRRRHRRGRSSADYRQRRCWRR
jgi:hypothetical protein